MTIRELQLIELDILKQVIAVCRENNISYFMLGGTLLGAVRHKGFIPWDDDIDIGMPRDDYERFIEIIHDALPEYLKLQYFKDDIEYHKYSIRVIDKRYKVRRNDYSNEIESYIWIDIFPLDGMPSSNIKKRLHIFRPLFVRLLYAYSNFNLLVNMKRRRKIFEMVLVRIGMFITKIIKFDKRKQLYRIDRLLKKYTYNDSGYVGNFMGAYKSKELFPKIYYQDGAMYDFEDIKLRGPIEYDKILIQMYGDYMTPLPPEERFSHSIILDEANN
ncbi:phosphorylcholine transferase LicD [Spirochaetia bacterium]|nr:phosphorylcholine transferase LicD [Spirochaetia bacterium]